MSADLEKEIAALRKHLDELAGDTDVEWTKRYTLRRPRKPPGLYWQLRWLAGRLLRGLESMGVLRSDPWPVSLKQATTDARARPVLIWAVESDRGTLREACTGLSRQLAALPGFAPILITDVADFAFFSRLGWLVEYVPRLTGEGERYDERKLKFLARLYNGAAVLPVSAGLATNWTVEDFRRQLARDA